MDIKNPICYNTFAKCIINMGFTLPNRKGLLLNLQNYYNIDKAEIQDTNEFLFDYSSSGKRREWKEKKERADLLGDIYDIIEREYPTMGYFSRKADRLRQCGRQLTFDVMADESKRLSKALFCKIRLCPLCSWRRSLKIYSNMSSIMAEMKKAKKYRYMMLTLTVKNCKPNELNDTLNAMQKAFGKFRRLKPFKVVEGWYRGLEVTHNIRMNTYHPHYHIILAVPNSYFTGRNYVKQEQWGLMWKESMQLDYNPIIDIRKIVGETCRAVSEVAKYTVKDTDYLNPEDLDMTVEAVQTLDKALANKRLVAYGGIMKQIHKELNLGDEVDGDLIHTDEDAIQEGLAVTQETYIWNTGYRNYLRFRP